MKLIITQENNNDFDAVFEINKLAFGRENEAKLVNALRNSPEAFIPELSLVATLNNSLVGHILFTRIKIINDRQHEYASLALAPMAVKPGFQKTGIGAQLIQSGLRKASELNFTSVIVLGHKHYYPKFGFVPAGKWGIKAPFNVPPEAFMGIELVEDGLKNVQGTVKYAAPFNNF